MRASEHLGSFRIHRECVLVTLKETRDIAEPGTASGALAPKEAHFIT
jgi:hypothetical protein